MTILRTNIGNTRERARQLRFEPAGAITQTNVQKAIEQVSTQPSAISSTPVAVGQSPYTVLLTDTFLYLDTAGGSITINLQPAAARAGIPLVIKDVTGHGFANPVSLVPSGAETVDSLAPYPLNADFGGVKLNPLAGGYTVSP